MASKSCTASLPIGAVNMLDDLAVARSELILGGQKSGKSRRAELLALAWLAQSPAHSAVLIATAQPWDDEMRERIERHQADRAKRVPSLRVVEEPVQLAVALGKLSQLHTLVVVDCLTLWLTNLLMPAPNNEPNMRSAQGTQALIAMLLGVIDRAPGPIALVGNEIGLGVIPMGRDTRAFVDALGGLNQAVAQMCQRVTFMAAGLPMILKDQP